MTVCPTNEGTEDVCGPLLSPLYSLSLTRPPNCIVETALHWLLNLPLNLCTQLLEHMHAGVGAGPPGPPPAHALNGDLPALLALLGVPAPDAVLEELSRVPWFGETSLCNLHYRGSIGSP